MIPTYSAVHLANLPHGLDLDRDDPVALETHLAIVAGMAMAQGPLSRAPERAGNYVIFASKTDLDFYLLVWSEYAAMKFGE
jgi:hypothetical protein